MNTKRILSTILFAILTLGLAGCGIAGLSSQDSGSVSASGTIDADTIRVAPELGGKIASENVKKGDAVKAGDVLFKLDDVLLKAQRQQAAAALDTAKSNATTAQAAVGSVQAQYDLAYSSAMVQDRASRSKDWYGNQKGAFTLPLWYYNQQEEINSAQVAVDNAQKALDAAQANLDQISQTSGADFVKAETDLSNAQADYNVANDLNNRVKNGQNIDDMTRRQLYLLQRDQSLNSKGVDPKWGSSAALDQDLRDEAQHNYDDANQALEDAQRAYDDASSSNGAAQVQKARAQLSIEQERYYTAQDYLRALETGPEAQTVTAAGKALDQAKSTADQAQTAIGQAEANLATLDAEISKLTVAAPVSGFVLSNPVKAGETVAAGSTVFEIGNLDEVTLTVYVTEDQVGKVKLGDQASVTVDTFPGEKFVGQVTYIADQAEFTPRNIQTSESRSTTVYAVEIRLLNPNYKLKPGMPADATITAGQ